MVTYLRKKQTERSDRKNAERVEYKIGRRQIQGPMFGSILRSISTMNKSIRARRIKYKREKPRLSMTGDIALFFSFSFCLYIFFSSRPHRAVAAAAHSEKRQRARWEEGCATTGRLLLTHGCSRRIIHEPSRETEFNLALRQRSLEKREMKREQQEGWMVKGLWRRMRDSTEAWSPSWFFGFADPAAVCYWWMWGSGPWKRSI